MSGEFNIFGNLDALKNVNLLDKLKSLENSNAAKDANDTNGLLSSDDSDLDKDFESMLNNNVTKKSPSKRRKMNNVEASDEICAQAKSKNAKGTEDTVASKDKKDKAKKKGRKTVHRRSTSSSERSLSPTLDCLVNFDKNAGHNDVMDTVPELPRVTRKSFDALRKIAEKNAAAAAEAERRDKENTSKIKGRGGRGRGRGRGRGPSGRNAIAENLSNDNSCSNNTDSDGEYVPQALGEADTHALTYIPSPVGVLAGLPSIMESFLGLARGRGRQTRNSQSARSRRNQMAELAARSTQVDFVDLVSSPLPRVEGTISLDSDGEIDPNQQPISLGRRKHTETTSTLDVSIEEDNPEISVKIKWNGKPESFKLRKYQKFAVIIQKLAERENADMDSIVLNLDDRIITADDTPESIDYKIFQFINGRVVTMKFNSPLATGKTAVTKKHRNANQISVKVQSDKWKRPLQIDIKKTDLFRILYIKCAEELNITTEKISLSFDGEPLELNDTPADLDLEGGEVIDLRLRE